MATKTVSSRGQAVVAMLVIMVLAASAVVPPPAGAPGVTGSPVPDEGLELALDAAVLPGGVRLVAMIWPVGPKGEEMPRQRLALDSASSSLVFCDRSLGEALQRLQAPLTACNTYQGDSAEVGYWGHVYLGAMELRDGSITDRVYYTVMQAKVGMPCADGVHGLFGISRLLLDRYYEYVGSPSWPPGSTGLCPISSRRSDEVPAALAMLRAGRSPKQLGIYWSGQYGRGQGALYMDRAATYNSHYVQEVVLGQARIGQTNGFAVAVDTIAFAGRAWAGFSCDIDGSHPGACVFDLAAQALSVPPEVYEHIQATYSRGLQFGSLCIRLEGVPGRPPVTLEFDVSILLQMGWLKPNPKLGVVLGLPLWAFFYTVFDLSKNSVTFVPTRLNNPWSGASMGGAMIGLGNSTATELGSSGGSKNGPWRLRRLGGAAVHV